MKIIQKHYVDNVNESGMILLSPQETNILLVKNFIFITFLSTELIGYKFSKDDILSFSNSFSSEAYKKEFYISNNSMKEVIVQYSCIHY